MNRIVIANGDPEADGAGGLDAAGRLDEITVPAIVACGELDVPTTIRRGVELAGQLPNAGYRTLPGRAHLPYLEDADEVAALRGGRSTILFETEEAARAVASSISQPEGIVTLDSLEVGEAPARMEIDFEPQRRGEGMPACSCSRTIARVAAAAVASLAAAGTAQAAFEGRNGRIAFARDGKIYTIGPDGRALRLLTPKGHGRAAPTWSRDGSRIAFLRFDRRRGTAVFVMRADGSRARRVSAYTRRLVGPAAWRPLGRRLLYAEHSGDTDPAVGAVKLVRSDGSGRRNLTGDRDLNLNPSWSPDGRRIALVRVAGGDPQGFGTPGAEIWTMGEDGSGKTRLTHNDVLDDAPAWSPDGTRIAFARTVPGPEADRGAALWTMRPDGADARALTSGDGAFDERPEWSPDGSRLLFTRSHPGGRVEAFTVRPDGSGLTRIAEARRRAQFEVTWSPDSRRVAIADGRTIAVARADGTRPRRLARGGALVDWQAR